MYDLMLRLSGAKRKQRDEGIALITVIMVLLVMSVLVVVAVRNLGSQLTQTKRQRDITTARAAADSGIDRLVFTLGQSTNWTALKDSYGTSTNAWWGDTTKPVADPNYGWWMAGKGRYRAHIDCDQSNCTTGDLNKRLITVQAEYPAGSGNERTLQAVIQRQAPEALGFSLFADRGIDIHHHSSSFIAPTLYTPKIHSNGYIRLDWDSQYRVESMSAVGNLQIAAGGGALPSGSIPSTGYTWAYWISGADATNPPRCYPPKKFPPQAYDSANWNLLPTTGTSQTCPATPLYSPNAQVIGNVLANSVQVKVSGNTKQPDTATTCSSGAAGLNDPVTGVCIATQNGNIDAGSVVTSGGGGGTYQGAATGNAVAVHFKPGTSPAPCSPISATCVEDCPECNQGSADNGGHVGGWINLHPKTWAPGVIEFPSLNYRATNYPVALAQQGSGGSGGTTEPCNTEAANTGAGTTCHIFPTSGTTGANTSLLTYLSTPNNARSANGPYSASDTTGPSGCNSACVTWLDSNKHYTTTKAKVAYVIARGTYFLKSGTDLKFDQANIRSLFGTPATAQAPIIMFAGALVVEKGDLKLQSPVRVVGPTMDPFQPAASGLASTTVPGLLAAGGSINATDFDTDSSWTSTGQYESLKRNEVIVRGLVYSAYWDSTAKKSVATDEHWHNYDPKNSSIIIGAQAGGKLHNCNNFTFSYDPLIANLSGFTGSAGAPFVLQWKEL